jgi:hypothetical protein
LSEVNEWQTRLIENYSRVLDDATYPADNPSRRALYPHERLLLDSCLESLASTREEYVEQIRRCGPLSDSTKQSAEINEEDHGKAILVFTVVTVIFLPLSFVTSFLGMNTSDIRDMNSTQKVFWEIAMPLTAVVMGTMLFIAYNGDELRDRLGFIYRTLAGKQNHSTSARGISVAQRKRAVRRPSGSSSTLEYKADEAEYATPKPDNWNEIYHSGFLSAQVEDNTKLEQCLVSGPQIRSGQHKSTERFQVAVDDSKSYFADPYSKMSQIPTSHGYQPGHIPNLPTYMRINRAHILPETLAFYNLPWEFDPLDINYVLVKRSLGPRETEMLFEHTRTLRESGMEEVGYGGRRASGLMERGEYTWVKKRENGKRWRRGRNMDNEFDRG